MAAARCAVCWEDVETLVHCEGQNDLIHSCCPDCFRGHINQLNVQHFLNLRPCCFDPACERRFTISDVLTHYLNKENFEHYIDLNRPIENAENEANNMGRTQKLVLQCNDLLNIRCPNGDCNLPQDPAPDGCRAVRCGHCGTHYCWLCGFVSANSQLNHAHVLTHTGDLFVPQAEVDVFLRNRRARDLMQFLTHLPPSDAVDVINYGNTRQILLEMALSEDDIRIARREIPMPNDRFLNPPVGPPVNPPVYLYAINTRTVARNAVIESLNTNQIRFSSWFPNSIANFTVDFAKKLFSVAFLFGDFTAAIDSGLIVYDVVRFATNYHPPPNFKTQFFNRIYSLSVNASAIVLVRWLNHHFKVQE